MAILLRVGDIVLWGYPDPEPVEIYKIHNSDPIVGKLRIETSAGELRVSSRAKFGVVVMLNGKPQL